MTYSLIYLKTASARLSYAKLSTKWTESETVKLLYGSQVPVRSQAPQFYHKSLRLLWGALQY